MGEGAMANHALSWRNRKTLILSRTDMMGLVTPAEYVACVEQAYRMHGEGRFIMDPKGHIVLDKYPGEWEAMPSYIEEPESAACKWVSIRERNRAQFDLPTVFSILIYTHPETGISAGDLRRQLPHCHAPGRRPRCRPSGWLAATRRCSRSSVPAIRRRERCRRATPSLTGRRSAYGAGRTRRWTTSGAAWSR